MSKSEIKSVGEIGSAKLKEMSVSNPLANAVLDFVICRFVFWVYYF